MTSAPNENIFLIDGFSLLFRSYYAIPQLTQKDVMPVSALYGFLTSLLKLVEEERAARLCVLLDSPGKGVRHTFYPDYKANRADAPEDLLVQIQELPKMLDLLDIPTVRQQGYEADDLIASFVKQAQKHGKKATIVSSDKDLMQLVQKDVSFYNVSKNTRMGQQDVFEKFGVWPEQMCEYLMLVGDASDNVPGVSGVGPKTAAKLLNEYGSVDNIYANYELLKPGQKKSFEAYKDFRETSYALIRLYDELAVSFDDDFFWKGSSLNGVTKVVETYGFQSLKGRLGGLTSVQKVEAVPAQEVLCVDQNQDAFKESVELSGYVCSVDGTHWSCGEGPVYQGDSSHPSIQEMLMRVDVTKLFYNVPPGVQVSGDCEYVEAVAYVAFGAVSASSLVKVKECSHVFESCVNPKDINIHLCGQMLCVYLQGMKRLFEQRLIGWYKNVELPLFSVLSAIMQRGVQLDTSKFEGLQNYLEEKLKLYESEIFKHAGCEFNVASSQQMAKVLYDDLGVLKKKTRSTDASVLEEARDDHPIVDVILHWRRTHKLLSTYVRALPEKAENSVVHTHFSSVSTLSGRLNSFNPNLQNIPVRSEEGRKVRDCFVARHDHVFLAFDYSQIELRLLAHYAGEGPLREGFRSNRDVHVQTASLLYDVQASDVSADQRRLAKVINFGVIYGMGASSLAARLNVSRVDAENLLENFYQRYPDILEYQESMRKQAEQYGYVSTIFNRRCYLDMAMSTTRHEKAYAFRQAVNIPLQGSNADMMKKVMVSVKKEVPEAHMVLQVHDELLFEIPKEKAALYAPEIKSLMESVVELKVPVVVNMKQGESWGSLRWR